MNAFAFYGGPRTGTTLGNTGVTVNGTSSVVTVGGSGYKKPAPVGSIPLVSGGPFRTDTFTVDVGDITGVTSIDVLRSSDDFVFDTDVGTTFVPSTLANAVGNTGINIKVRVVSSSGTFFSPDFQVFSSLMMGMAMPASHLTDERAVLSVVPMDEVTHIAIDDGDWSDASNWLGGVVPGDGSFAFIPLDISMTYDNSIANVRLDRVRVDGTLTWALDQSTEMLTESLIVSRTGSMIIGTSSGRVPAQYTARIKISGKDYSADKLTDTDLRSSDYLATRGWGRGIVVLGVCRIWGREKTTWFKADPINAGATSLTSRQPLVGVEVGDEICIGGTDITYTYDDVNAHAPVYEDEYRTITAIDGNTISWSGTGNAGLTHAHKNQLRTSTREDLYPNIMVRNGKNVIFESEVKTDNARRGHFAIMHHSATADIWDLAVIGFGRTDKSRAAGVIDSNGDLYAADAINPAGTQGDNWRVTETLTSRANVVARYSVHLHLLGYNHMGAKPIVSNCYVEDTPGWGYVHHDCDADFFDNVCHKFWGCGMVSESGSEVGAWVGNLMMTATYESRPNPYNGAVKNLYGEPKNLAGPEADEGDTFREGFGYGFRGRGMRTNRNVANSVSFGNVFYHRFNSTDAIQPPVNMRRDVVDIAGQNYAQNPNSASGNDDDFIFFDYPIVHHADNEAVACIGGLFVSKELHLQDHDVNVKLKRLKTWGYAMYGASVEYIGVYIIDGFDAIAGDRYRGQTSGFRIGANTYQNAVVNLRSEGNREAVYLNPQDTTDQHDDFDADDPRWFIIGADSVNDTNYRYNDDAKHVDRTKTIEEVMYDERDWDDSEITYDQDPTCSLPALMAERDDWANRANNTDGRKTDNISSNSRIFFKPMDDSPFFTVDTFIDTYRNGAGYYTVSGGPANGLPCVVQAILISDRVTGRPSKRTYFWDITGHVGGTNNGTFTYSTVPVVQSDKTLTVSAGGSATLDVVTGATGGGGAGTYVLDVEDGVNALSGDYIAPDNGVVSFNVATGELTYTPDRGYTGTDEMYVFVKSQGQYATVRVTVLVGGTPGTIDVPAVTTNFTVADHADANTFGITLGDAPDAGGRRIEKVEYTTDGGTTWRRLCHHWVQAVHKVTVESDGTAVANGSYTVSIRYKTNYDFQTTAGSTGVPFTVS